MTNTEEPAAAVEPADLLKVQGAAVEAVDMASRQTSASADDEGEAAANERRRRKKKPQVPSVFESVPKPSSADVQHVASTAGRAAAEQEIEAALDQAESPACVFESQPSGSLADVAAEAAGGSRSRSHTVAAQALIAAAAQGDELGEPSVFESMPRQTTADAAANGSCRSSGDECLAAVSVFESTPAPSRADTLHGDGTRLAQAAEATILQAAEAAPEAEVGVFESRPARSKADVLHGASGSQVRAAQALIQHAAEGAPSGVFESVPSKSTASVRHGEAAESSSGEEETDEEEEEDVCQGAVAAARASLSGSLRGAGPRPMPAA